ncbi:hypothetical protein E2I00_002063 [Balaenoptera physalus]|uniref:Uncharacterized protein n=1 Tax=Balaenoptera physalus TaxID=9770 RepID=A0A643BNG0_BALPH|nr:hypothetical protein E2I00_002063 [Balaenoptera physalus]
MLQQIFRLFHTERSSAAWDTSLLDKLRTGLHQQLEDLDACLKKYSDCAWEIVRVEIMRSLSSSNTLQERIRIMDRDLGSP